MPLPVKVADLVNALEQASTRVSSNDSSMFLKLDKVDGWIFGADDIQVEEESKWAVNPNSFATGFQAWDDSEFEDERMGLITDPPIVRSELPDVDGEWNAAIAFQLVCLDGEDKGTQVLYKTSSKGGAKAFKVLVSEVLLRARANEAALVPIINLDTDSYKHAKYGKISTPVLTIVDWGDMDAAVPQADDEPEPEPEIEEPVAKPRRTRRRK